ncbi:helix-turn-helix domain-containing protein [Marinobacterium sp. D7]|uniref:helix-turn-helix domain-containing protein n=1 Tax=Marinobacterium ramblicola TaxID=2849041 RepID=UPI001C2D1623|nr:helix-turn-helix transcriptional regulator [Marinobacterium ramblicola]MBV1790367.1 helix-turn-helix domain-containing protein [Marinobacterium ramblicola]
MHIMTQELNKNSVQKLAKRIHEKRLECGLTLVDLGSACDVHHSQLSRIERGKVVRVSKNMEKICTFLQINPYTLDKDQDVPLLDRVERVIASSSASARAIESLVTALEELTENRTRHTD